MIRYWIKDSSVAAMAVHTVPIVFYCLPSSAALGCSNRAVMKSIPAAWVLCLTHLTMGIGNDAPKSQVENNTRAKPGLIRGTGPKQNIKSLGGKD